MIDLRTKFTKWYYRKGYTMNPVGRENMRAIIQKNGWTEVK